MGINFACRPFTKNKERIEKLIRTGNTNFIYKNELYKACFQHDMAHGKSKDLAKRTQSDKVLRDKVFKIAGGPKYDSYQRGRALISLSLIRTSFLFLIKRVLVEQLNCS